MTIFCNLKKKSMYLLYTQYSSLTYLLSPRNIDGKYIYTINKAIHEALPVKMARTATTAIQVTTVWS